MKIAHVCRFSILAVLFLLYPMRTHSQTTLSAERINFKESWIMMSEGEKQILVDGIRFGILIPMMMLEHMSSTEKQSGQQESARLLGETRQILSEALFYRDNNKLISEAEILEGIDLFYRNEANRHLNFASAVYWVIVFMPSGYPTR
jgi:hypothetical protein